MPPVLQPGYALSAFLWYRTAITPRGRRPQQAKQGLLGSTASVITATSTRCCMPSCRSVCRALQVAAIGAGAGRSGQPEEVIGDARIGACLVDAAGSIARCVGKIKADGI